MRIITGIAKGSRLKAPKGLLTRPTTDRVKESLFNILRNLVLDANVLDIFAGTGNLGLEALSRGANHVVFVDNNRESIQIIKENAQHTKLINQTEIYKMDVFSMLMKLCQQNTQFDLIFCDPPYNKGFVQKVLEIIDGSNILKKDGILVIEHDKKDILDVQCKFLRLLRQEKYGATSISFFLFDSKNKCVEE